MLTYGISRGRPSYGRRRLASVLALSSSILLLMLFLAPPASAAVTCTYTGGTDTLTVDLAAGDSVALSVGSSDNILVNGNPTNSAPCSLGLGSDLTTAPADVDVIAVNGSTGAESVTISNGGTAVFPTRSTSRWAVAARELTR